MNTSAILVAAFPALLIVGVLLAPLLARRDRPARSRRDDSGHSQARDRGAPISMTETRLANERSGDDAPAKGDQYFADWAALQARFNEEPA